MLRRARDLPPTDGPPRSWRRITRSSHQIEGLRLADAHDDLPARLFLGVGSNEQVGGGGWKNEGFPDEAIAAIRAVDNCQELYARLAARRYPGLDLEFVVFEGEYHLTIGAAAITRGLLSLELTPASSASPAPPQGRRSPAR